MNSYMHNHNKWWVGVTSEETFIHKRKIEHFKNSSMQKNGMQSGGVCETDQQCRPGMFCEGGDCANITGATNSSKNQ